MPVFTIQCVDRKKKKTTVANTVDELLQKGAKKFGVEKFVSVVIDESGANVDEDEVLEQLSQNTGLILLQEGEEWTPVIEESSTIVTDFVTESDARSADVSEKNDEASTPSTSRRRLDYDELRVPPPATSVGSPGLCPLPESPATSQHGKVTSAATSTMSPSSGPSPAAQSQIAHQVRLTPMEPFTLFLKSSLKATKPGHLSAKLFTLASQQAADYYLEKVPNINGFKNNYGYIAEKIVEEFPALRAGGKDPWNHFQNLLQKRINYRKWTIGGGAERVKAKKSLPRGVCPAPSPTTQINPPRIEASEETEPAPSRMSDEEYKAHLVKLHAAWEDKKKNDQEKRCTIVAVLETTFKTNKRWIFKSSASLKMLQERMPCFKDCRYIRFQFVLTVTKPVFQKMRAQMQIFKKAMVEIMDTENPTFQDMLQYVEKETWSQNRFCSSKPLLQIHEDVPDEEVASHIESTVTDCPHLVGFQDLGEKKMKRMFVVGLGTYSTQELTNDTFDLEPFFLALIGLYYVANVAFPKCYCGVLGVCQQYYLGEIYDQYRSTGFKLLEPRLQAAIDQVES